jgi:hypothetical protein
MTFLQSHTDIIASVFVEGRGGEDIANSRPVTVRELAPREPILQRRSRGGVVHSEAMWALKSGCQKSIKLGGIYDSIR